MSIAFYKLLHLIAIFLVFGQLGITVAHAGRLEGQWKKLTSAMHGIGLLLLFVSGFGMLAKLGIMGFPWPAWVWVKLGVWLAIGASATWIHKMPEKATLSLFLIIVLGTVAAYMALYKPF